MPETEETPPTLVDTWKKFRRPKSCLTTHAVDQLCQNVMEVYRELPNPDRHLMFLNTGQTQLMLGLGREPKQHITSVRRIAVALIFNGHFILVNFQRFGLTVFDSYETYCPSARSDFLNSIMIHMRPLIGFSAEMKIKYAAVPQQQPMTNECGLHLVNNLCNLLFLVPVENKLTRKNISKTWRPCVPGALSHRPALTEELHDEEIIDTQDCLGQLMLHPDNDRGDMDTEGWDQSVAYDDTFEL